jgi:ribosomal protein L30/L7E
MILVIRIAGQVKNKEKDNETLNRLKIRKKFSAILVEEKDNIRMGMVKAASHKVSYGKVTPDFVKKLNEKRPAKDGVYFLHPPRGGFKKSSKVAAPKGILGEQSDFVKFAERFL